MGKLIKIRPGEEFKLKLFDSSLIIHWLLLNENETQKYFQLLRNFESFECNLSSAAEIRCYSCFLFKALKSTKEDMIFKFGKNLKSGRDV